MDMSCGVTSRIEVIFNFQMRYKRKKRNFPTTPLDLYNKELLNPMPLYIAHTPLSSARKACRSHTCQGNINEPVSLSFSLALKSQESQNKKFLPAADDECKPL